MIYVLAIFLPPLALLIRGKVGHAILNVFLCLFFWLPGVIHAIAVIADDKAKERNAALLKALGGVPVESPKAIKPAVAGPSTAAQFQALHPLAQLLTVALLLAGLGLVTAVARGYFSSNARPVLSEPTAVYPTPQLEMDTRGMDSVTQKTP